MPYVMVPVPEEHVQEAMEAVLRIAQRASLVEWDEQAISDLYQELDEAAKAVLSVVTRANAKGETVSDVEVASAVELTQREILGVVREINDRARDQSRPALVITQMTTRKLPNGRTIEQRTVSIPVTLVDVLVEAERADLAATPNPLAGLEE